MVRRIFVRWATRLRLELRARGYPVTVFKLWPASGPASYDSAAATIERGQLTLFVTADRPVASRGTIGQIPDPLKALIATTAGAQPAILVSMGSPYVIEDLPEVGSYLVGWRSNPITEQAVARALGGGHVDNRPAADLHPPGLPSGLGHSAAGAVSRGWISLAIVAAACAPGNPPTPPTTVPALKTNWQPAMQFLDSAVAAGAAPGAVLAVTHNGERFVYGTGQLGADEPQHPDGSTVYDLASLTKVVGLVTMVMLAVDEGRTRSRCTGPALRPGIHRTGKGSGHRSPAPRACQRSARLAPAVS